MPLPADHLTSRSDSAQQAPGRAAWSPRVIAGGPKASPAIAVVAERNASLGDPYGQSVRTTQAALTGAGHRVEVVATGRTFVSDLLEVEPALVVVATIDPHLGDGVVQDLLEMVGLQYFGSPPLSLRTCANKAVAKTMLGRAGVCTPEGHVMTSGGVFALGSAAALPHLVEQLGLPIVVKPVGGHSGRGVRMAQTTETLPHIITSAFNYDSELLVERAVRGLELSVLVAGSAEQPAVLGACAVENDLWLTGRADDGCALTGCRTDAAVAAVAVDAYRALGCEDAAIVDLIVDATGVVWVLGADLRLDATPNGKLAAIAHGSELAVEELIADLVSSALRRTRHPGRAR